LHTTLHKGHYLSYCRILDKEQIVLLVGVSFYACQRFGYGACPAGHAL